MKKEYIAPQIEIVSPCHKPVMFTTSTDVSDDPINPVGPFDAKKSDLNIEFRDIWEE